MRYYTIIVPLALMTTLSACSGKYFRIDPNRPSNVYEICSKLKRDIIFYHNDPNFNFQWRSPNDAAVFIRQYQQYNCDEVLANKGNVTYKQTPLSVPPPRATGGPDVHVPAPPTKNR